ncbi:MAG: hypothetical protein GY835_12195 [bacterium]|nr:hypothetical protein [bacterium]
MSQQNQFMEEHWPAMQGAMERVGPAGVKEFIDGFENPDERRQLYFYGQQAFGGRDWSGKDLLIAAEFVRMGITEMLNQSADAGEDSDGLKDLGNIMSFNLAADLADCWPGDDLPRDNRHFELGLNAAEDCLRWRAELKRGPNPFAMAWWIKGMHELSLARPAEALASFQQYRQFAIEYATGENLDVSVSGAGHWSTLLAEGYVAIGLCATGDAAGRAELDECITALEAARTAQPGEKDSLQFCLDQLNKVESNYL